MAFLFKKRANRAEFVTAFELTLAAYQDWVDNQFKAMSHLAEAQAALSTGEIEEFSSTYSWMGGMKPFAATALLDSMKSLQDVVPDWEPYRRVQRLFTKLVDNQLKAMSHVPEAQAALGTGDIQEYSSIRRMSHIHMRRAHEFAEKLVPLVEALPDSDPIRLLLQKAAESHFGQDSNPPADSRQ